MIRALLLASLFVLVGLTFVAPGASATVDQCSPYLVSNPSARVCVDYTGINNWCVSATESGSGTGTNTVQKCEHFIGPY